jgi:two-component system sensor histidine kinase PilS (NtrC family)
MDERAELRRRLAQLVAFRLAFAAITLGALAVTQTIFGESKLGSDPFFEALTPLAELALAVFATALVVLVALHLGWVHLALAHFQVLADLLTVSVVLVRGGGAQSPFALLLAVVVMSAASVMPRRQVLVVAAAAACILIAEAFFLERLNGRLVFSVLTQVVAFFAVGYLTSIFSVENARSESRRVLAELELRRLERFHERVLESLNSGILTTDTSGRIAFVNRAAAEICALEPEAMLARHVRDLIPELPELVDASGERSEITLHTKTGTRIVGYSTVQLKEGERLLGSTLVFRDLTDIRAMEQRTAQSEKLASLGRLAAGIAHEIRNPLGAVSGAVELVAQNPHLDASERSVLAIATTEVTRLNGLISEFLDFARPRQPERARFDLRVLARETVHVIAQDPKLTDRAVTVVGESAFAWVDPNHIHQVFWNLIKNACEATAPGGQVTVTVHDADPARVCVSDDGVGASDLSHLFEPFFTTKPAGTGLGLAVVAQLVQAHGGHVSARRGEPRGMVFEVSLPRHG